MLPGVEVEVSQGRRTRARCLSPFLLGALPPCFRAGGAEAGLLNSHPHTHACAAQVTIRSSRYEKKQLCTMDGLYTSRISNTMSHRIQPFLDMFWRTEKRTLGALRNQVSKNPQAGKGCTTVAERIHRLVFHEGLYTNCTSCVNKDQGPYGLTSNTVELTLTLEPFSPEAGPSRTLSSHNDGSPRGRCGSGGARRLIKEILLC